MSIPSGTDDLKMEQMAKKWNRWQVLNKEIKKFSVSLILSMHDFEKIQHSLCFFVLVDSTSRC